MRHPLSSQCTASSKRSGERCRRQVIGGGVCIMHGGAAPAVRAKREGRIIAGMAARAARGDVAPRDPVEALLAAARDADAIVQRLKSNFAAGVVVDGATLSVLGEWLDRVSRLSKVCVDARLDERRAALEEAQARMVLLAFDRALNAIERLTERERQEAGRVLVRELRVIEAADG
jgi:hypothetical protein